MLCFYVSYIIFLEDNFQRQINSLFADNRANNSPIQTPLVKRKNPVHSPQKH